MQPGATAPIHWQRSTRGQRAAHRRRLCGHAWPPSPAQQGLAGRRSGEGAGQCTWAGEVCCTCASAATAARAAPAAHLQVRQLAPAVVQPQRMYQVFVSVARRLAPLSVQPGAHAVLLQAGFVRARHRRSRPQARYEPRQPSKPGRGARHGARGFGAARARRAGRVSANE